MLLLTISISPIEGRGVLLHWAFKLEEGGAGLEGAVAGGDAWQLNVFLIGVQLGLGHIGSTFFKKGSAKPFFVADSTILAVTDEGVLTSRGVAVVLGENLEKLKVSGFGSLIKNGKTGVSICPVIHLTKLQTLRDHAIGQDLSPGLNGSENVELAIVSDPIASQDKGMVLGKTLCQEGHPLFPPKVHKRRWARSARIIAIIDVSPSQIHVRIHLRGQVDAGAVRH